LGAVRIEILQSSNTLDDVSHAKFLNAYLVAKGATPVNLNKFRTLAKHAKQVGRLTDLSRWIRVGM
jgi:hypothetical protein